MKRRTAFTLVEWLAVIGIIALLISILLPALNKARQAAKDVTCASNVRQIAVACSVYSNMYKGYTVPYFGTTQGNIDFASAAGAKAQFERAAAGAGRGVGG